MDLSANALAQALGVPPNRISLILAGERGVTADTALRLARAFGTTPEFWLNLQQSYELRLAEQDKETKTALKSIRRLVA
jgi:addiction module HigA family antidote